MGEIWRINSIEITNFKFFKQPFKLSVERKNLLLYGENGSGKSSIYWAFYTMFQSCYKEPTRDGAMKYFIPEKEENLRNKFSCDDDGSSLKLELMSKDKITRLYEVSNSICNTHVPGDSLMTLSAAGSDFLNYKFLSDLLDFKNSEEYDVFSTFEKDIFPTMICSTRFAAKYVKTDEQKTIAYWWKYINSQPILLPKSARSSHQFNQGSQMYKEFQQFIHDFNNECRQQLNLLQDRVARILSDDFKISVNINLQFIPVEFNNKIAGTVKVYDGLVHRPKIILSAQMTNKALPDGPVEIYKPRSFFNEAKLTCIALAFRLAVVDMKYKGDDASTALFIDDLLISLDMGNRLHVIDILLKLKERFQLFIFTHDRAFYEIIAAKTKEDKSNWIRKEIYALDESLCDGGVPGPFMKDKDDYLDKAIHYLHSCDLPACANYLRKALEYEFNRLYPVTYQICINNDGKSEKADLSTLISQLTRFSDRYNIPLKFVDNIDVHRRRILNPLSHDDLHTPIYRDELRDCIKEIKVLRSIERKDIVWTKSEIEQNRYCISHSRNDKSVKVIFRFVEIYNYIKLGNDTNVEVKRYYSNSKIEILYSNHPNIFKCDPDNDNVRGLFNLSMRFLGYTNEDKPSYEDIVKEYSKENQLSDLVDSLYYSQHYHKTKSN